MFDLLQGCLSFSCFPQIFHRINKQVGCLLFLLSLCRLCGNSRPRQLNTKYRELLFRPRPRNCPAHCTTQSRRCSNESSLRGTCSELYQHWSWWWYSRRAIDSCWWHVCLLFDINLDAGWSGDSATHPAPEGDNGQWCDPRSSSRHHHCQHRSSGHLHHHTCTWLLTCSHSGLENVTFSLDQKEKIQMLRCDASILFDIQ